MTSPEAAPLATARSHLTALFFRDEVTEDLLGLLEATAAAVRRVTGRDEAKAAAAAAAEEEVVLVVGNDAPVVPALLGTDLTLTWPLSFSAGRTPQDWACCFLALMAFSLSPWVMVFGLLLLLALDC